MAVQEIARVLRIRIEEDRDGLRRRYGADAVAVVENMMDTISVRLQEESPYGTLWNAFRRNPRDHSAELIGALEALVEGDPGLARRMDAFLKEFHEAMQTERTPESTNTPSESVVTEAEAPESALGPLAPGTPITREPYYPDTGTQVEHESVAGDGTYLYGNVKGGKEEVGRSTGVDTFDFGERVRAVQLENLSGLPTYFDEIFATLEDISEMPLTLRLEVRTALQDLREEIAEGEAANRDSVKERLLTLRRKAPDVAEAVMQALETIEVASPVERGVREARQAEL